MTNNKSFIKQLIDVGIGTFITLIIGFITTPLITRIVDPSAYGNFALFNTYSTILLSVLGMGLDQTYLRYFYKSKDMYYQDKLLQKCIYLPIILYIVGGVSAIILRISLNRYKIDDFVFTIFLLHILVLIINRFSLVNIRLKYRMKLYSVISCITKCSYVFLAIALVKVSEVQALHCLILANFLSVLLATIIGLFFERGSWNFFKVSKYPLNIRYKELLCYGLPLMLSTSVFSLFQATDRMALNYYCDSYTVGIYASAQSLITVFSVIQTTFNTVWAPKAIEKYENGESRETYSKMTQIITIVMFTFGSTVLVCKGLFALLLGEKYREAAFIIPFLMLNPIMYTISETTTIGISLKNKTVYQVYTMLISCACNILGNIILIPILGSKGAALSTGISYILFFSLRTFFSVRLYKVNYHLGKLYIMIVLFVICAIFNSFFDNILLNIFLYIVFMISIIVLYYNILFEIIDLVKLKIKNRKREIDSNG